MYIYIYDTICTSCGRSSSVECELPKLERRVRFPSPAPCIKNHDVIYIMAFFIYNDIININLNVLYNSYKEPNMKLSARNQLKGTIVEIQEGAVNAIVKINVGNDNIITADITVQSVKELGLTVGKEVYAVIKATNVMVGIE